MAIIYVQDGGRIAISGMVTVCRTSLTLSSSSFDGEICLGSKEGEQIIEAQVTKLLDDSADRWGSLGTPHSAGGTSIQPGWCNWVRAMCESCHGQLAFWIRTPTPG